MGATTTVTTMDPPITTAEVVTLSTLALLEVHPEAMEARSR